METKQQQEQEKEGITKDSAINSMLEGKSVHES
jgi:hypothetical protein